MPEIIHPANRTEWLRLRMKDVTSSEVAALFGVSPYMTEFELWHRKKEGAIVELEENERMVWGVRLESAIAEGIAADEGWTIRRMDEYLRDPVSRIGASFDFAIDWTIDKEQACHKADGLLEVKNVDSFIYKDGWLVDGDNIEAPPHIELQVQHQLLVSGRAFAYLGALIGGNRVILQRREPDLTVHKAIRQKVVAFWESLDTNTPPIPDYNRDAAFAAKLAAYAEPGTVLDAWGNQEIATLVSQYKEHGDAERQAKNAKAIIKAELLGAIGDAEKVTGEGFTISAGMVGPAHVSYDRVGYRNMRVYVRKVKKEALDDSQASR